MQPQQGWNNGVQPLDAAHQLEQFSWGQHQQSMNTGRNQPIRGGQMMPNQPMNPQRPQNPPYPQQNYGGWQQPMYPTNFPQYPANGNGGNGGNGGGNHPPAGLGASIRSIASRRTSLSAASRRVKKLLKRILFCACAVAVICGLVAAGGAISNAIQEQNEREALVASVTAYDDKYVPNVYVDGIHLGGMTRAEAEEAVTAHANQQRDAWKVRLMYAGQLVREITSADLNMTVDVREALGAAWQPGHTEGSIDARKATMDALAEKSLRGVFRHAQRRQCGD